LFTFHDGSVSAEDRGKLVSAFQCGRTILLLPAPKGFAPKDIAALLLETGATAETQVCICENVTLENEKVTQTTLEEAAKQNFGSLCVMVIKQPLS
jgi:precorrin-6B methylase 1